MNISSVSGFFSPKISTTPNFKGTIALPRAASRDTFERAAADKLTHDCKQFSKYQKAKPFIIENFKNDIIDKAAGKKTQCSYVTLPGDEHDYKRIAIADNKVVGISELKLSPYAGRKKPIRWPDSQDFDTNQIVYLSTLSGYTGVGTDLIKGAVMDSIASGKNGRILIKAKPEALPKNYKDLCADKIENSPVPFYYKIGFKFINSRDDQRAQRAIVNMSKTKQYPPSAPQTGFMYLKESDGWKLLDPKNDFFAAS